MIFRFGIGHHLPALGIERQKVNVPVNILRVIDLWLGLAFGILGYLLKKLDYPIAPLVLAMVLGDKAEDAFRQSMIFSKGSMGIFWSNGLVGTITTLALVLLFWPMIASLIKKLRAQPAEARA